VTARVQETLGGINGGCRLGCINLASQAKYIIGDTCICE
jgi:hypothetical protein